MPTGTRSTPATVTEHGPGNQPAGDRRKRPWWTLVAVGCLVGLAAVVLGNSWIRRNDAAPSRPPFAEEQDIGEATDTPVEDPRSYPGFDLAYDTVCVQTITGIDSLYAAAAAGAPDFAAQIGMQQKALLQRIADVYARPDLWDATDPLVLEYAEMIADDLAAVLDGTDIGFDYLDGDVVLFRSLCDDWATPI